MPPDGADDRVKLLAFETSESHAQVLSVDDKGQCSFIHVQNDCVEERENVYQDDVYSH